MDQFIAGYGPLPADLAASQDMDADRLARLDRIGPAVLPTPLRLRPERLADCRPQAGVGASHRQRGADRSALRRNSQYWPAELGADRGAADL